ncbi:MAG: RNA-binding protein, partial [Microcystis sp. M54BS1]|nr:RNA-binding protein [Microcystis sp. M62BS1]MCA2510711.1 RNA-binding protein [Microcystis sp. M60BS1]MCA2514648.1 RNA-binding protein [Microcystis sp. M59BS1]MCA2519056.1 RNA-binding protein [Microcystis sp. M63BS1]MCA2524235.1 RNA-binding protein [Microcystis sp. M61BS1]MCA2529125.1 RNA-binding protein [Microcystis sp. M51BS1]MCA2535965.1 RNA-binding protein [Microcystis sp. M57BS1]MCA2538855.1 RNA-binding protein [Microcystis sp. M54BS1]MCA2544218.1 RNA-binding protein [Microcystis sp.
NEARDREERAPFNGGGGDRKKRY